HPGDGRSPSRCSTQADRPAPSTRFRRVTRTSVFFSTLASHFDGLQRMPARVSGVFLVPELHVGLAQAPAEQHLAAADLAGKVDQAKPPILELDAKLLELALVAVDLAG